MNMNYHVRAYWVRGTIGWLIANTNGHYCWQTNKDDTKTWYFENGEDAMAFKLKFGAYERV